MAARARGGTSGGAAPLSARRARSVERVRFPGVQAPKPLLPPETERRLTARQRELLDELEELFSAEGFADLTMAQIAAQVNCSLRTLYGISAGKDELVLTVVDRRLHRIGRAAIEPLHAAMSPLEALRGYLRTVSEALQPTTVGYARELVRISGATRLIDTHESYVIAVTRSLLDRAVAERQITAIDTAAVAHVLGGLGREFALPEVAETLRASPKVTTNAVAEIILRGLERG